MDIRKNKLISAALLLLFLIGATAIPLLFIFADTDESYTQYPTEPLDGSPGTLKPPLSTTTSTTVTVPTARSTTANTTPFMTEIVKTSRTASTTSLMKTTTTTYASQVSSNGPDSPTTMTTTAVPSEATTTASTRPSTTGTTTPSTKRITTASPTRSTTTSTMSVTISTVPNTTSITTSPIATITNTPTPQGRPMNPKTILCTFGHTSGPLTVGPQDGVCDIIIFDFFYGSKRGTFLNQNEAPLRWFLNYTRNNNGTTEFGMGIEDSQVSVATEDLSKSEAQNAVRDFWSLKIRHYGLLKFPVHDALVNKSSTATEYTLLMKKLRELQEINGAGKYDEPGYIILGIGLNAPRNSDAYDYLREILRSAPVDAVVIRTHLEDLPKTPESCKITGPNVYVEPFNTYEVSMVEALDYVQNHRDLFRGLSLMVSFSMSLFIARPRFITDSDDSFQLGKDCRDNKPFAVWAICLFSKKDFSERLVPTQHVMLSIDRRDREATIYDSPNTIMWKSKPSKKKDEVLLTKLRFERNSRYVQTADKTRMQTVVLPCKICTSTKRYRTLQFGVALFRLEHEDGSRKCDEGRRFKHAAGYWRAEQVSRYIKDVIRNPDFLSLNFTC